MLIPSGDIDAITVCSVRSSAICVLTRSSSAPVPLIAACCATPNVAASSPASAALASSEDELSAKRSGQTTFAPFSALWTPTAARPKKIKAPATLRAIVDAVSIRINATVASSSAPRTAKTSAMMGRAESQVQLAVATTPVTLRDARPSVMMTTANSANLRVASASFLNSKNELRNLFMPCPCVALSAFGDPEDQQRTQDGQRKADNVADELLPCALAFLRRALVLMQKHHLDTGNDGR